MEAIEHNNTTNFQENATNGMYLLVGGSGGYMMLAKCPDCSCEKTIELDAWDGFFGNPNKLNNFDKKTTTLSDPVTFNCGWSGNLTNGEWNEIL